MSRLTRRHVLTGTLLAAGAAGSLTLIRTEASAEELTVEAVLYDPDNPVLGNPDGDVTIVEFFDYQCPYCKANHPELTETAAADGNVRLVMKDWPIFGAASVRASQLALGAASLQGYRAANEALMATEGRLDDTHIADALGAAGFDIAALDAAYRENRDTWDGLMRRNSEQAALLGLRGTPAFIIGTTLYPGAMDAPALRGAIAAARG
ncbi:thioredoxin domain-containing protein [Aquicoccus sp. SCR17]|nr:thioredoxin domain-containing protein [Carideicomes alvinocaridis]